MYLDREMVRMRKLLIAVLVTVLLLGVVVQPRLVSGNTKSTVTKGRLSMSESGIDPQNVYWAKTYGGSGDDEITDVKVLPSGDIIAVGYTNSAGAGNYDAFVMKLSPNGSVIWAKTYGGPDDDRAYSIAVATNGDIIVTGYYGEKWTEDNGTWYITTPPDAWVFKLDPDGNMIWQKTYGGSGNDVAKSVVVESNGNILVGGVTDSFGAGEDDLWVLKLNPSGGVIWQKTYGRGNEEGSTFGLDYDRIIVRQWNDGLLLVGDTTSFGANVSNTSDIWVLRLDENGNVLWQETYGGGKWDRPEDALVTPEGDVIIAGWSYSFSVGEDDAWVLKLNSDGNILWQKTYGGKYWDYADAVTLSPNGDIIVVGGTSSFGAGDDDVWILRLDPNGNVIWQKTYGGKGDDEAYAVALAPNGNIIVAGYTNSFGSADYDAWVLDVPLDGSVSLPYSALTNATSMTSYCLVSNTWAEVSQSNAIPQESQALVYSWSPEVGTQFFVPLRSYWVRSYGGTWNDTITATAFAPNGDLIAVGYTGSAGAGGYDAFVMRLSPNGNLIWAKTYGGTKNDYAYSVAVAPNGDIIVVGKTYSSGAGRSDAWVLKLDPDGNVIWQKTYGGGDYDWASGVAVTVNGSIVVVGCTASYGAGTSHWWGGHITDFNLWVFELDPDGNIIWQESYGTGGGGGEWANCVTIAPGGDIVVVGAYDMQFNQTADSWYGGDAWVIRLAPNGKTVWQKTYGGDGTDEASAVTVTPNGDIVVAGYTDSFGAGDYDAWVLKLDPYGNVIWQKTYGGIYSDYADTVSMAPNDDIVVAGYTYSFGSGGDDTWVFKLDPEGNIVWQSTYGGSSWDWANSMTVDPNGNVIIAGVTWSFGAGNEDAWVLSLPPTGNLTDYSVYGIPDATINIPQVQVSNSNVGMDKTGASVSFPSNIHSNSWTPEIFEQMKNGAISVSSTPSGAQVYLDGAYEGVTPLTISVQPGTYNITLKLPGYKVYSEFITVESGKELNISVALQPLPVSLTITSEPSGASVYINGAYKGTTPLTLSVTPGTYEVKLTKQGYKNYMTTVELSPDKSKTLSVTLSPIYGRVQITSIPSGAKVYVNSSYKGMTPLSLSLPPGMYTIKVSKQGYKNYETTLILSAGEHKAISVTLTPAFGHVTVTSTPSGASVYIDGKYAGTTPLENYKLSTGEHTVKVEKEGYETYTTKVDVSPGGTATVSATLRPLPVKLSITSKPSGASVYINGAYKGTTPLTLSLTPGTYDVRIVKKGYKTWEKSVTVEVASPLKLTMSLTALPPTSSTSTTSTSSKTSSTSSTSTTSMTSIPKTSTTSTHTTSTTSSTSASNANTISTTSLSHTTSTTSSSRPPASSMSSRKGKAHPGPLASKLPYVGLGIAVLIIILVAVGLSRRGRKKTIPGFPPELLGKYEPLEFLGEGGFAKVFKVKRRKDGKIVAVKVPHLDEKAKRFFLKEVKAWTLLDHPNIVKLYGAFEEPIPHLEMEFVEGTEINGKLVRDLGDYPKPVDEMTAVKLISGIAEGLKHAHYKSVYHRDLKPQNILLKSDLIPKITDWGLAKVGAISTTATTARGLTLLYAAPEQLDEEAYGNTDHRTDIYQLGLIFYELLTGKQPYTGPSITVVMGKITNPNVRPEPPSKVNPILAKYDGIFERLLAKRKEDRYQSVEEFLNDLILLVEIDRKRKRLEEEIEKTKTTMSMTTDTEELEWLKRRAIEQVSELAIANARLNDKPALIKALEDLKAFSKEYRKELESAIAQVEMMVEESVPIGKNTLEEIQVLVNRVRREYGV